MNGSMVTGVLGNVLVLSPLVIVAQGRLTHRLLVALTDDIVNSQMGFQLYYAGLGKPSLFNEKRSHFRLYQTIHGQCKPSIRQRLSNRQDRKHGHMIE
jgi:hypothetical protein